MTARLPHSTTGAPRHPGRTRLALWCTGALLVVAGAGCSSSGSSAKSTTTGSGGTTTTTARSDGAAKPVDAAPLTIVVTDDDGIDAPGIDEIARQLTALPGVTVKVVAPATNQSGTGDKTTQGTVDHHTGKTASGIAGVAVEGTPADSVLVALDVLKLQPDLVVSGINKGQNVGPIAGISGTVGAAKTAARKGVPAIAGSAALTDPDYVPAARFVVEWVVANRARLAAHSVDTAHIVNINTPGCTSGKAHGLVKVPAATKMPEGVNPFATDCAATDPDAKPTDDVQALVDGFSAQSLVAIS